MMAADLGTCRKLTFTDVTIQSRTDNASNAPARKDAGKLAVALVGKKLFCLAAKFLVSSMRYLHAVDLVQKSWSPRLYAGALSPGQLFLLVGDKLTLMYINRSRSLLLYDIALNQIGFLATSGTTPDGLKDFVYEYMEWSKEIFVFGGEHHNYMSNELFILSIESKRWKVVDDYKGTAPRPVSRASSCVDRDKLYVYGGWRIGGDFSSDLHLLSTSNGYAWSTICRFTNVPNEASRMIVNCGNRLMLFGGTFRVQDSIGIFEKANEELTPWSRTNIQLENSPLQLSQRVAVKVANSVMVVDELDIPNQRLQGLIIWPTPS